MSRHPDDSDFVEYEYFFDDNDEFEDYEELDEYDEDDEELN